MNAAQALIEEAQEFLASHANANRKPEDILGRILRHPECRLDWKTATLEDFANEAVRLGWDFALMQRMGI